MRDQHGFSYVGKSLSSCACLFSLQESCRLAHLPPRPPETSPHRCLSLTCRVGTMVEKVYMACTLSVLPAIIPLHLTSSWDREPHSETSQEPAVGIAALLPGGCLAGRKLPSCRLIGNNSEARKPYSPPEHSESHDLQAKSCCGMGLSKHRLLSYCRDALCRHDLFRSQTPPPTKTHFSLAYVVPRRGNEICGSFLVVFCLASGTLFVC